MHRSTMLRMEWFINNYIKEDNKRVLDVGSYSVNGSYRDLLRDKKVEYVGLDIEAGPNVDIVMDEPYAWTSIPDESFDYIISGQAFEHIEYPWLTIKEIFKKLKPGGVICIIAPNSTPEHRYPFDCYRYFADGLTALAKWAGFEVLDATVAGIPERNVSPEWYTEHNDACLIARKPLAGMQPGEMPKFKYERRFSWREDLKLSCDFLTKWNVDKAVANGIKEFIKNEKLSKVYIYGRAYIGSVLFEALKEFSEIEPEFIGPDSMEVEELESVLDLPEANDMEKDACILIAYLDHNRDIQHYLKERYPLLPSFYVDEILKLQQMKDFLKKQKEIFLYGAGIYGKDFLDFLCRYNLKPTGFIVSEGERKQKELYEYPVYELQELEPSNTMGVVITVKNSSAQEEIAEKLYTRGFKNYIVG